jgi:LAO/AO transport system kinase
MISLGRRDREGPMWRPPIVKTVAARGEGIDEVVEAIESHHTWMTEHGELGERRSRRAAGEIEAIALQRLRSRFGDVHGGAALQQLAERVVVGELDPYAAAEQLIEGLG